jgi:16S rRNA (cytosine967-C5)-methyltransferase
VSRTGSQLRTLVDLLGHLRRHWRADLSLPARIDSLLGRDRRLGSRDRRLYRELIYAALRYLPWVEALLETDPEEAARRVAWLAPDTPAVNPFRSELTAGLPACPPEVDGKARLLGADPEALTPKWFLRECPEAAGPPLREVLLTRAPLWLRLQTAETDGVREEFERRGWPWKPSPLLAGALELAPDSDVARSEAYLSGRVEIQDIGSQLVLAAAGIPFAGRWLDACAGAGGKTLQLAALLGPDGRVDARDIRRAPLDQLAQRAARAGLSSRIEVGWTEDPPGGYDGVLVDAPCSGSGTWRRFPHLRWQTSARSIREAGQRQLDLLLENASRVRPGGLLAYSTCSLCRTENEAVTEGFLVSRADFAEAAPGRRLLPQDHDGDGFYAIVYRRRPGS